MTDRPNYVAKTLLFAVIFAMLLQPISAIDLSYSTPETLPEETSVSSTGARAAQTEWVASAVQSAGANTQNPNLVFPSDILVDSSDNTLTVGNLVADITLEPKASRLNANWALLH